MPESLNFSAYKFLKPDSTFIVHRLGVVELHTVGNDKLNILAHFLLTVVLPADDFLKHGGQIHGLLDDAVIAGHFLC